MNSLRDIHHRAMELASLAHREDDPDRRRQIFTEAYALERDAASKSKEPLSRAVIYRSAGWLAYHALMLDDAFECAEISLNLNIAEADAKALYDRVAQKRVMLHVFYVDAHGKRYESARVYAFKRARLALERKREAARRLRASCDWAIILLDGTIVKHSAGWRPEWYQSYIKQTKGTP